MGKGASSPLHDSHNDSVSTKKVFRKIQNLRFVESLDILPNSTHLRHVVLTNISQCLLETSFTLFQKPAVIFTDFSLLTKAHFRYFTFMNLEEEKINNEATNNIKNKQLYGKIFCMAL